MTFGTERRNRFSGSDHRCLPPNAPLQRLLGGVALAFVATLCGWTVCVFADVGAGQTEVAVTRGARVNAALTFADRFARAYGLGAAAAPFDARFSLDRPSHFADQTDVAVTRGGRVDAALTFSDRFARADSVGDMYATSFDARFSPDRPSHFANEAPQRSDGIALAPFSDRFAGANQNTPDVSVPPTRDRTTKTAASSAQRLNPTRSVALRDGGQGKQTASDTPENKPTLLQSILQKLFGRPAPVKLAYAATDDTALSAGGSIAGYDRWTAVYDISAHTVYMPDGTRLEAHSGLGSWLDDPRYPDEKMRGVTPPNIYNLQLRESAFHGVRALRLIPEDGEKVFGRRGLLVHTYMLGPNGDSNGCVSIKKYDAFLQAYLNHDIKRLAVVTRLD